MYTSPTCPRRAQIYLPVRPSHNRMDLSKEAEEIYRPSGENAQWFTIFWCPVSRQIGCLASEGRHRKLVRSSLPLSMRSAPHLLMHSWYLTMAACLCSSRVANSFPVWSCPPVRVVASVFKAKVFTQCAWPLSSRTNTPDAGFHTLTDRSLPPLYKRPPVSAHSPDHRICITGAEWPDRVANLRPLEASHTRMDLSFDAVATLGN
mmetsp:Transcript_56771/g.124489  ORF Transcript_56771/g.124489 Transcript_56771/m.124489 type:complete len:205 (+) Transcript_56771:458-1072(+)